jgi:hypothetical protein
MSETLLAELPADAEVRAAACPDCGEPIEGRFCALCGEKRVEERDYSLSHFLGEALNVIADLESPLTRSFFALLFRPGLLTAEYLAGRRKRYLKPVQLFVFCNIIFFFAQPLAGFNTLNTPLRVHLSGLPYSAAAQRMVAGKLEREKIAPGEYHARFDATSKNQAHTLVILMVPLLSLVLLALYWRRRRYFVEHLVFATHFYAIFLLLLLALHLFTLLAFRLVRLLGVAPFAVNEDLLLTGVLMSLVGTYLFVALRRVYGEGRAATLLKCLALLFSMLLILQTYRLALFFTAFYTA